MSHVKSMVHRKNDFTEVLKNLIKNTNLKIILLGHQDMYRTLK